VIDSAGSVQPMTKDILKFAIRSNRERAVTMLHVLIPVVFVLSLISQINAQTTSSEAKRLFQEGVKAKEKFAYDDAMKKFEEALKLTPEYSEALHALGLVYIAKKMNEQAVRTFNEVLRLNPNPRMVREANWAIMRLQNSRSEKNQRRNITAPNVKKLIAGWDKIIPAVRNVCDALQSFLDTGDFSGAEEKLENTRRLLNSNSYYPKWYVMQFEKLLVSPNDAQRLAVLTGLQDLMSEVECTEEWKFFSRPSLFSKLRSLARREKNITIREEAKQTVEKWEESQWWWYET
jgi:tetratricopeptide (TPR) repeat protein